jgi:protein-tyrosine phosphatase
VIDLHFHALPGIDDGPPDLEAAIALIRAAAAAGTRAIVATPHVSWEFPNSAQGIAAGVRQLNSELAERGIAVAVYAGAEVALTSAFDRSAAELRALRLGGGPWLLVEPPHIPAAAGVEDLLHGLQARGERIVLAHVERCPTFLEDPGLLGRLVASGMLASVTAASLTGGFGRVVQRASERFIAGGLIHNVASDAHDCDGRPPGVLDALEAAGLAAQAPWLTQQVPEAILRGTALPPPPVWPQAAPRGLLRRLTGRSGRRG